MNNWKNGNYKLCSVSGRTIDVLTSLSIPSATGDGNAICWAQTVQSELTNAGDYIGELDLDTFSELESLRLMYVEGAEDFILYLTC